MESTDRDEDQPEDKKNGKKNISDDSEIDIGPFYKKIDEKKKTFNNKDQDSQSHTDIGYAVIKEIRKLVFTVFQIPPLSILKNRISL